MKRYLDKEGKLSNNELAEFGSYLTTMIPDLASIPWRQYESSNCMLEALFNVFREVYSFSPSQKEEMLRAERADMLWIYIVRFYNSCTLLETDHARSLGLGRLDDHQFIHEINCEIEEIDDERGDDEHLEYLKHRLAACRFWKKFLQNNTVSRVA